MPSATRTVLRAGLGIGTAGVGVLGWASLIERNAFVVRRFTVPVLPVGSPSLRVLHVSDLHLLPRQRRKAAFVRSLASLDPDLVVNTGDNISSADAVPAALDAQRPLLERPGVFALGSNDYYAPTYKNPLRYLIKSKRDPNAEAGSERLPTAELVRGFEGGGWLNLNNRRAELTVRGLSLAFVGVDDPHIKRDRLDLVRGPAPSGTDLVMGVTHAPYQRVLDAFTADGARLVIAGHTHGGQVCVPGYGALVTNCDLDTGRAKGLSRWWPGADAAPASPAPPDAAWLEVSAGLGTSPAAPVRLACRPEATLLTLVAVDGEPG